jgi:hypothetical protein
MHPLNYDKEAVIKYGMIITEQAVPNGQKPK